MIDMTNNLFDIFISTLTRAIFKGNNPQNTFGVDTAKIYKKHERLILKAISSIPPGDKVNIDQQANAILSPFSYVDQDFGRERGDIFVPTGKLSLKKEYLFPGKGGTRVDLMINDLEKRLSSVSDQQLKHLSSYDKAHIFLSIVQYYAGTIPMGKGRNPSVYMIMPLFLQL